MRLLIDIGNSRVKWTLASGEQLQPPRICGHDDCAAAWASLEKRPALFCSVAAPPREEQALAALTGWEVTRVQPVSRCAGVINGYARPETLGADRWASLMGARAMYPGHDLVIVDAGTAVTVDGLHADGRHVGGAILAGAVASRRGLTSAAPGLPATGGRPSLPARNTADGVAGGTWIGLAGAVERVVGAIEAELEGAELLLTGGDAEALHPLLDHDSTVDATLSLRGLLAAEEDGCAG